MKLRAVLLLTLEEQRTAEQGDWLAIDPAGVRLPTGMVPVLRDFTTTIGQARVRLHKGRLVAVAEVTEDAYQPGDRLVAGVAVHQARHPGGIAACDLKTTSLTQRPLLSNHPQAEPVS